MAAEAQTLKLQKHLQTLANAGCILMQVYKVLFVLHIVGLSCTFV